MIAFNIKNWTLADWAILISALSAMFFYVWAASAQHESNKNEIIKVKESIVEFKSQSSGRFEVIENNAKDSAKSQEDIKRMLHDIDKKLDRVENNVDWMRNKK